VALGRESGRGIGGIAGIFRVVAAQRLHGGIVEAGGGGGRDAVLVRRRQGLSGGEG
jgi:hypothetical protein